MNKPRCTCDPGPEGQHQNWCDLEYGLGDMHESVVLNPSAIGNPDETPKLFVGAGLRAVLNPCPGTEAFGWCGGVNGYHIDGCPKVIPEGSQP